MTFTIAEAVMYGLVIFLFGLRFGINRKEAAQADAIAAAARQASTAE